MSRTNGSIYVFKKQISWWIGLNSFMIIRFERAKNGAAVLSDHETSDWSNFSLNDDCSDCDIYSYQSLPSLFLFKIFCSEAFQTTNWKEGFFQTSWSALSLYLTVLGFLSMALFKKHSLSERYFKFICLKRNS